MILSKPQGRSQQAMMFFLVLCYAGLFFLIYQLWSQQEPSLWTYGGALLIILIAVPITIRNFSNYKIIQAGKGRITVDYRFRLQQKRFELEDLEDVKEETIKTFNTEYKLLSLHFGNGFLEISNQEYTNYEKLKAYVDKNKPKRKKTKL